MQHSEQFAGIYNLITAEAEKAKPWTWNTSVCLQQSGWLSGSFVCQKGEEKEKRDQKGK